MADAAVSAVSLGYTVGKDLVGALRQRGHLGAVWTTLIQELCVLLKRVSPHLDAST
jgi:hypothetical protein